MSQMWTDTQTDGHSEYNVNPTSQYSTRILNYLTSFFPAQDGDVTMINYCSAYFRYQWLGNLQCHSFCMYIHYSPKVDANKIRGQKDVLILSM